MKGYHTNQFEAQTDNGETITITIKNVEMEKHEAQELFDLGREVPGWGWKRKVWENIDPADFPNIQKAARFFYGWDGDSERVTFNQDGTMNYDAWYAC